jgi:hypothetical protein
MPTLPRVSTTDMEVTSIRLERSLKEKLKALAGDRGYQALIRDILWQYVEQPPAAAPSRIQTDDLCATFGAIATQPQVCAITGQSIASQAPMRLGLTRQGQIVPLCLE